MFIQCLMSLEMQSKVKTFSCENAHILLLFAPCRRVAEYKIIRSDFEHA